MQWAQIKCKFWGDINKKILKTLIWNSPKKKPPGHPWSHFNKNVVGWFTAHVRACYYPPWCLGMMRWRQNFPRQSKTCFFWVVPPPLPSNLVTTCPITPHHEGIVVIPLIFNYWLLLEMLNPHLVTVTTRMSMFLEATRFFTCSTAKFLQKPSFATGILQKVNIPKLLPGRVVTTQLLQISISKWLSYWE